MNDVADAPYEDPTPSEGTSLITLVNVRKAIEGLEDEKDAEHDRLHKELDEKYRVILARSYAAYYDALAEVYADGFGAEEIGVVLQKATDY